MDYTSFMWNALKEFFYKFFSHNLSPVNEVLTPDSTTNVVTLKVEQDSQGPVRAVPVTKPKETTAGRSIDQKLTENFRLSEFKCRDGTAVPKKYMKNISKLAKNLQVLRDEVGKPIHITSGYRTPEYNKKVGGVKSSQHMLANASDITIEGMSPKKVAAKIKALIKEGKMDKGGVGEYKKFVHYDVRGVNRRWFGAGVKK